MTSEVVSLYPGPVATRPLEGTLLELDLRSRPVVYTDFVTSLDGKIAVGLGDRDPQGVPEALTGDHDWRLYQELAYQADAIVVSGRYLRELAEGRAGPVADPRFTDLAEWRLRRGLSPLPTLAVVSGSLDVDPTPARDRGHDVTVITARSGDAAAVRRLESAGAHVVAGGAERVTGRGLVDALRRAGHAVVFSGAGPAVTWTLLADDALDMVFVTLAGRILAGDRYVTMVEGPGLSPARAAALRRLWLDPQGPGAVPQLYAMYEVRAATPSR